MAARWDAGVEQIGDAHGRIALMLDKQGALDLAATFGPSDSAYDELLAAVARAYPEDDAEVDTDRLAYGG